MKKHQDKIINTIITNAAQEVNEKASALQEKPTKLWVMCDPSGHLLRTPDTGRRTTYTSESRALVGLSSWVGYYLWQQVLRAISTELGGTNTIQGNACRSYYLVNKEALVRQIIESGGWHVKSIA